MDTCIFSAVPATQTIATRRAKLGSLRFDTQINVSWFLGFFVDGEIT